MPHHIADIRREYGQLSLSEQGVCESPFAQFDLWFTEVLNVEKTDPTAMVLATSDEHGYPDTRVVLLKEQKDGAFVFYTNYQSTKSIHIHSNPHVALNFFWPEMSRQIRIRGLAKKISEERSDAYFESRPRSSQLSAIASKQSRIINGVSELQQAFEEVSLQHSQGPVVRPDFWGGYEVIPDEMEFWQGRDNRLHDRILYRCLQGRWHHCRLAP